VVLCYFFVDRPVAMFVHEHRFLQQEVWQWPPRISDWIKDAAPFAILAVVAWWVFKPGGRFQKTVLAICANLLVATGLKELLKWSFGRYWPETWKQHNPSLIGSGDYGFHPFHRGVAYSSFPSGHAAVVCSVLAILWLAYPRWRWLYAAVGVSLCLALVGMNYHFVGDVVAGVAIGVVTGVYVTRLFRLEPS
jgi:membrane-associated phospholipid phosphatase